MMQPVATAWVLLDAKMLGRPPISSHLPLLRFLLHSDMAVQEGRKVCQPKIGRHNSSGANNFGNRYSIMETILNFAQGYLFQNAGNANILI